MGSTSPHGKRVSRAVQPNPKRIVVCCDGTWQSATSLDPTKGASSNVARLCRVLAKAGVDKNNKVWQQQVYYDAGVGTGDITDFDQIREGALGVGLAENVVEAYNFIANNYSPGDELFFFGFSRGAYTVRAAAGLVGEIGVLEPASLPSFIQHYHNYMHTKSDHPTTFSTFEPWVEYVKANLDCVIETYDKVTIQVIGAWDTVGSLGVPEVGHFGFKHKASTKAYQFYDTDLNDRIKHAYQALALDERRSAFSPSLWKLKSDNTTTKLIQCWFPGAHINVGGGSSLDMKGNLKEEQLASITYAWMLDRIRPHLAFSETQLEEQFLPFDVLADTKSPQTPLSPAKILWETVKRKTLPTGYAKGTINNSFTFMYRLLGSPVDRTPNAYHDPNAGEKTNERIHPSVYYRQLASLRHNQEVYEPAAMRGWVREFEKDGIDEKGRKCQGWMWKKYKDSSKKEVESQLWEFEIQAELEDSLEYRLIENSWVENIHKLVMKAWKIEPDSSSS
ncbi:hypothetical protein G7Y89_g4362 [Cudoniella acicularis]|uniref:T6SS Phospholipase effector Tle1-like catalytic domain-containing protein n=1 Tax=Cudoniella acicularis TaxID=354080 RepID=A0A8H4W523_9HELO|nr:hypothetical protein G7Y89_g4362 [Cudoniella acicularis]